MVLKVIPRRNDHHTRVGAEQVETGLAVVVRPLGSESSVVFTDQATWHRSAMSLTFTHPLTLQTSREAEAELSENLTLHCGENEREDGSGSGVIGYTQRSMS